MLGLWLTTIGIMAIYFTCTYFFAYFVKSPMNSHDASKVDPLPEDHNHDM